MNAANDAGPLRAWHIDWPRPEDPVGPAFTVAGWALGRGSPVVAVTRPVKRRCADALAVVSARRALTRVNMWSFRTNASLGGNGNVEMCERTVRPADR